MLRLIGCGRLSPIPSLRPITYVLECKWGLVNKMDVNEFFGVFKWSMELDYGTPEGRQLKQRAINIFAG